jgi:hypothetical protein
MNTFAALLNRMCIVIQYSNARQYTSGLITFCKLWEYFSRMVFTLDCRSIQTLQHRKLIYVLIIAHQQTSLIFQAELFTTLFEAVGLTIRQNKW